jgi:hypothetical protein
MTEPPGFGGEDDGEGGVGATVDDDLIKFVMLLGSCEVMVLLWAWYTSDADDS